MEVGTTSRWGALMLFAALVCAAFAIDGLQGQESYGRGPRLPCSCSPCPGSPKRPCCCRVQACSEPTDTSSGGEPKFLSPPSAASV